MRSLYKRGIKKLSEWAEPLCDGWVEFERECGTCAEEDAAAKWVAGHRAEMAKRVAQREAKQQAVAEDRAVRNTAFLPPLLRWREWR